MNASGLNLIYSSFLGGIFDDYGYGIALDTAGSAYITGKTGSPDFPSTNGAYRTDYQGGDNDIFIAKFTPNQAGLVYSTYLGSPGSDEGYAIAVDNAGNAYVTGDTDSNSFPATSDAFQRNRSGNRDAFVAALSANGSSLTYATYLGGTLNDLGYGIALDRAGNAYVCGITSSTSFPVNGSPAQPQLGGSGNPDAFAAKLQFTGASGLPLINASGVVNGASFSQGNVAPGSVISIFGSNLAGTGASASATPLPTTLGGVTVSVNGRNAPLYYASPAQINAQIPFETPAGSANVQVSSAGGGSNLTTINVANAAPYLSTAAGRAIVQNQDGSINSTSNPARIGSTVVIYFTGVGPVTTTPASGAPSVFATTTLPNSVTIGGANATVAYLGLTPGSVGLAQANVTVPSASTGDQPIVIAIGGTMSNRASIAVTQ